jgi:hypothetical protein
MIATGSDPGVAPAVAGMYQTAKGDMRMRMAVTLLLGVAWVAGLAAQAPPEVKATKRYGIEPDLDKYPQTMPKEALESVLKAIANNRIDYLLAQLADPEWVDQRVKTVHNGKFADLVEETTNKLSHDRTSVKEIRRFLHEGTWDITDATASAQLKDVPNRRLYLRKIGGRWFLENRQDGKAPKEK